MKNFLRIVPITVILLGGMVQYASAQGSPVHGEVKKINLEQGKITLRHGPITNLDMDGMTMVFVVTDPAMLRSVNAGDRVVFEADRVNGRLTVTKISKTKR